MDLSIIIVNWNTRELLRGCLASLEQRRHELAIQTIVVDNNSRDGSRDMVAQFFPEVTLIDSGANLGFARGNNLGLRRASAEFILFLNPDTEVDPGTLAKMVGWMRTHQDIGAVGCKIRGTSGETKELGLQWFPSPATELLKLFFVSHRNYKRLPRFFPYHDPDASGYVNKLFGACLMVRHDILQKIGSFDERFFMYCEDVDLCRRILDGGWKLFYMSDVEILHLGGGSSSKAPGPFSVLMTCESFSKLMRKYYGRLGALGYRLVTFVGAQARLGVLLLLRLGARVGLRSRMQDTGGSFAKYVAVIRWTLGLQKPTVRN